MRRQAQRQPTSSEAIYSSERGRSQASLKAIYKHVAPYDAASGRRSLRSCGNHHNGRKHQCDRGAEADHQCPSPGEHPLLGAIRGADDTAQEYETQEIPGGLTADETPVGRKRQQPKGENHGYQAVGGAIDSDLRSSRAVMRFICLLLHAIHARGGGRAEPCAG